MTMTLRQTPPAELEPSFTSGADVHNAAAGCRMSEIGSEHFNGVPSPVVITSFNATTIQEELSRAVEYLRDQVRGHRSPGILVTRHTSTRFSVSFSNDVPYGMSRERDLMRESRA